MLIIGDNVLALQNTLDLKGRGPLLAVSREIAWRKVRGRWTYDVGHRPSEHTRVPDTLSRIVAPKPEDWPYEALGTTVEMFCPNIAKIRQQ